MSETLQVIEAIDDQLRFLHINQLPHKRTDAFVSNSCDWIIAARSLKARDKLLSLFKQLPKERLVLIIINLASTASVLFSRDQKASVGKS